MSFLSGILGLLPDALEIGTKGLATTYSQERSKLNKHKQDLALESFRQHRRKGGDSSIETTNRIGDDVNMGYGGFRPTGNASPGGGPPGGGIGGRGVKGGAAGFFGGDAASQTDLAQGKAIGNLYDQASTTPTPRESTAASVGAPAGADEIEELKALTMKGREEVANINSGPPTLETAAKLRSVIDGIIDFARDSGLVDKEHPAYALYKDIYDKDIKRWEALEKEAAKAATKIREEDAKAEKSQGLRKAREIEESQNFFSDPGNREARSPSPGGLSDALSRKARKSLGGYDPAMQRSVGAPPGGAGVMSSLTGGAGPMGQTIGDKQPQPPMGGPTPKPPMGGPTPKPPMGQTVGDKQPQPPMGGPTSKPTTTPTPSPGGEPWKPTPEDMKIVESEGMDMADVRAIEDEAKRLYEEGKRVTFAVVLKNMMAAGVGGGSSDNSMGRARGGAQPPPIVSPPKGVSGLEHLSLGK